MAELKELPVSEKELALLKSVFMENDFGLRSIRSLFFGYDITPAENEWIKNTFQNAELREAFRKKIYPLMDNESPIGQVTDFWLGTETQIFGASRDTIFQAVQTKLLVKSYLEQALSLLSNPDGEKIELANPVSDVDPLQVRLLARNLYIKTIETGLLFIKLAVDAKPETKEEMKKRIAKNSNK